MLVADVRCLQQWKWARLRWSLAGYIAVSTGRSSSSNIALF